MIFVAFFGFSAVFARKFYLRICMLYLGCCLKSESVGVFVSWHGFVGEMYTAYFFAEEC
jgi:hypothetical protein